MHKVILAGIKYSIDILKQKFSMTLQIRNDTPDLHVKLYLLQLTLLTLLIMFK